MKQTGIVQRVHGPYVDVLVSRPDACHGCGACKLAADGPRTVTARNEAGAVVGDGVELELSGAMLMRAAGLAYGVPLVMFMLGLLAGEPIARGIGLAIGSSLAAAIAGFIFLGAGYGIVHLCDRSLGVGAFMSAAVRVVDPASMEGAARECAARTQAAPECAESMRLDGSEENR